MTSLLEFKNTRSSKTLAAALGWKEPELTRIDLIQGETVIDAQRGVICGESAAVFCTLVRRNGLDPLDEAALYAYHANAPWGILADEAGLTVFSSRWLVDANWFRLPHMSWDRVTQNSDIARAFTPDGLIQQLPARIAASVREPNEILKPIDDSLVERLDRWRDQAVRYARNAERVDAVLQTFYAQLFVLRTVEDRHLDDRIPGASTLLLGSDRFDRIGWIKLLSQAKQSIGSDLFDSDVTPNIPEHVLAGVVAEVYRPYRVPGTNARYNFAWIDSEVLGYAYEKYLASVLQPVSPPEQNDLFLPAERGVELMYPLISDNPESFGECSVLA
jgi:hypothetical protein